MSTAQPFSRPGEGVLTFGTCALNLASAQLTRDGRVVPLTPKAYDVLRYLVEHAGRLVTKQELLDAGWPDVFVGDAALKVCIREIRKALDDEAQKPQLHRDRAPARLPVHRARRARPGRVARAGCAGSPPFHPHDRSRFRGRTTRTAAT